MQGAARFPEPHADVASEIVARVIWYYYVGQLTQQDIADRFGLTRLRVNRIIGQARSDGSVQVDIRLALKSCVALEQALCDRFGLAEASVMPSVPDYDEMQRVIGEQAGRMLDRLLADGMTIGVGWGRTLYESVVRLRPRQFPRSWVVSLMGGLTRGSGTNTFEVSTRLADVLGAECYYLTAPIYCPSEAVRPALLAHYGLSEVMRRAREVDLALVSCGDLSGRSLLATTQTVQEHGDSLARSGAVGDLLGCFLDACGEPVDHPLNRQVVALPPADLKGAKVSVLASGGQNKPAIMRAILAGGYVNRVITDEDCAHAILGEGH